MNTQLPKYKEINQLKFIVLFLSIYFALSQGNLFMNSVLSPDGKYFNTFMYDNLNYIQWLRNLLIAPSDFILHLFGYETITSNHEILIIGGIKLNINYSCLGLGVMSFIIAFIIAFPVQLKNKWRVAIKLCFLVYLLNIVRITLLGAIFTSYPYQKLNLKYHHEIFNIIIYLVIIYILYNWVKKYLISSNRSNNG